MEDLNNPIHQLDLTFIENYPKVKGHMLGCLDGSVG